MSNPLLVSTFLVSKRKAIEEFQAQCGPPEEPFVKGKRPFSSIVHETRSFKPFKFSRTAKKLVKDTKLTSRQSRRRHHIAPESDESKLRTHQWSAKRMHFENVDGRMVAQISNRRSLKSTVRLYEKQSATLVNDSSYFQLLELRGHVDTLLDLFAQSTVCFDVILFFSLQLILINFKRRILVVNSLRLWRVEKYSNQKHPVSNTISYFTKRDDFQWDSSAHVKSYANRLLVKEMMAMLVNS